MNGTCGMSAPCAGGHTRRTVFRTGGRHEDDELHRVPRSLRRGARRRANDREEVVITRAGHEPVVIVSLEDYESLRETAYLMRSPANARRLLDAMERLEAGRGEPHDLIEAD